jgi:hypothetical protein
MGLGALSRAVEMGLAELQREILGEAERDLEPVRSSDRQNAGIVGTELDLELAERVPWTPEGWEVHMYGRLAALPDQAEPIQRARLLAALSVGNQLIELRGAASWLGVEEEFSSALRSFAAGRGAITASKSVPQTGHGVDAA